MDGRMKGVEKEAQIQRRLGNAGSGESGGAGGAAPNSEPGLSHLLDPESTSPTLPFVSKRSLQQAVEGLREELKNWLDVLHASIVNALQQKADAANLQDI